MEGVPLPNCVWFADPRFPKSKSKIVLKMCEAFNFRLKLLNVILKQVA